MSRLKKVATLETDNEMQGIENILQTSLAIELKPTLIEGFSENFEGSVKITMNNGDVIIWEYKSDPAGNEQEAADVTINGQTTSIAGSGNPPQDDIKTVYLQYLKING